MVQKNAKDIIWHLKISKRPETNAMKIEWSDLISSIKDCVKKTEAKPCMKNVDETMFEYYG